MKLRFVGRRARGALLLLMTCALFAAACNLITGAHDRVIEQGDATTPKNDRQGPGGEDTGTLDPFDGGGLVVDPPKDAGPDAKKTITFKIGTAWTSPNGATWEVLPANGGTRITAYVDPGSHAIIVPAPQPAIPEEDYTVWGIVRAPPGPPTNAEFGVLIRVQPNGSAVGVGSKWGQADEPLVPFMGNFQPPTWNPTLDAKGPDAGYVAGGRYRFKLEAKGGQVLGKMWPFPTGTEGEPGFAISVLSPWQTGRGVGFYTYGINGAILEDLEVTVP